VIAPTAAEVKAASEVDAITTATPAKLDRLVAIANSSFQKITGLKFADVDPDDEPIVTQAVTGLAEMTSYQTSPEYIETLADFDLIQSFNAGPYSETRRSAEDARKARLLVAWPWLSDILWNLLTPDKYDYWVSFFSGQNAPAFNYTEVDWTTTVSPFGLSSSPFVIEGD
jgi:hypothetical protein